MDSINATTFGLAVDADPKRSIAIEVGDSKQTEFFPQFKTTHWDNECNFSVRLVDADPTKGTVEQKGEAVEWARDGRTARFYPLPADDQNEDGAFEFDVVLSTPPPSNVLEFTIQAKGVRFIYQPPLDQEPKESFKKTAVTFTATDVLDAEGNVIAHRPENVVGSYAVFAAGRGIFNKEGGPDYRTGKMGHIYRPKVKDANGVEVWADLKIDTTAGILSVTVPQSFLDSAAYPVVVDPTFGYTSNGASEDGTDDFVLAYIPVASFTGATGSTIASGSWRGRRSSGSGSSTVYLGLYANGVGLPTTRHGFISASCSLTTTITTFPIAGTDSFSWVNGTTYWIATACSLGAGWRNEYDTGGIDDSYKPGTSLPSPYGAEDGGAGGRLYSFYFTYVEPGVGGGPWVGPSRIPNQNVGPMALRRLYHRQQFVPASTGTVFSDSLSEAVTASESQTAQVDFSSSITEALSSAETQTVTAVFSSTITEALSTAETAAATAVFVSDITESVSAADSCDAVITQEVAITETLSPSETVTAQADFVSTGSESVSASDAPSATADFVSAITEAVTSSESCDGISGTPCDQTDTCSPSDSCSATVVFAAAITESVTPSDAPSSTADFVASLVESVTVSDSCSYPTTQDASMTESINPSDTCDFEVPTARVGMFFKPGDPLINMLKKPATKQVLPLNQDDAVETGNAPAIRVIVGSVAVASSAQTTAQAPRFVESSAGHIAPGGDAATFIQQDEALAILEHLIDL